MKPFIKLPHLLLPVMLCAFISACSTRSAKLNEPVQHDDFFFSVTGVTYTTPQPLPNADTAASSLCLVTLQVENRAKRVPYTFSNNAAFLKDSSGREHQNDEAAQRNYLKSISQPWQAEYTLQPGQAQHITLAFRLAPSANGLTLHFTSDGYLMGDVLDGGVFYRTSIPIPAPSQSVHKPEY